MDTVHPEQLQARLNAKEEIMLLDVREAWEYDTCSIDNSINLPMSEIESNLSKWDKNLNIVVICHHGMRSYQVAAYMENIGFNNMINLEGGIELWAQTVDPEMTRY